MLILVRHGQSTGNAGGLLLGRGEWPLTPLGVVQAKAVAAALAGHSPGASRPTALATPSGLGHLAPALGEGAGSVMAVVSSPSGRAVETARVVAEACGTGPVTKDERWLELDYGELDGRHVADVPDGLWERWRHDTSFAPPGGESLAHLGQRVRSACEAMAGRDGPLRADRHTVVVSHVSPIKAAVAWALDADDSVAWRLYLAPGSVTVLGWARGGPVLRGYNICPGEPPGG